MSFLAEPLPHPLSVFHSCWERLSGEHVGGSSWHPLRTQEPPSTDPAQVPKNQAHSSSSGLQCSSQETAVYLGEVLSRACSQLELCFPLQCPRPPQEAGLAWRRGGKAVLPGVVCEKGEPALLCTQFQTLATTRPTQSRQHFPV